MQDSSPYASFGETATSGSPFETSVTPSDEELILLNAIAAGMVENPKYKERLADWGTRASVPASSLDAVYRGLGPMQFSDSVFTDPSDETPRKERALNIYEALRRDANDRTKLSALVSGCCGIYARCRVYVWKPAETPLEGREQVLPFAFKTFAGCTGPTELSHLLIDSQLIQRCMSAVSEKDQGWGKVLKGQGCHYSLDAHHAVAKEFQLELLAQSAEPQPNSNLFCLRRITFPRIYLMSTVEMISFSLADPGILGVPVCKTADGLFTVFDGNLPAFGSGNKKDLRTITITLLLNWPGHETAYVPFDILHCCTRQEFAQRICREIIVWATVLSCMPKRTWAMEERWPICTPETDLENIWLTFARRLDGHTNTWIVDLQLGK